MGKKKYKTEKVLKLPPGTYRVTGPIRARKIVGTGPPPPPPPPLASTGGALISHVNVNTTGTNRPFIELGRDNVVIEYCTMFGPDPSLQTLVRSWARRQYQGSRLQQLLRVR